MRCLMVGIRLKMKKIGKKEINFNFTNDKQYLMTKNIKVLNLGSRNDNFKVVYLYFHWLAKQEKIKNQLMAELKKI